MAKRLFKSFKQAKKAAKERGTGVYKVGKKLWYVGSYRAALKSARQKR